MDEEKLELLQWKQKALEMEKMNLELQSQLMQVRYNGITSELIPILTEIKKIEEAGKEGGVKDET